MIHGLGLIHGKKHLIRASMEGVMYELYSVYDIITQIDNNVEQIIANGGYVNSDIWLQIQADIFNKEIAVAQIGEAAAFGAAYVAMAAVGAIEGLHVKLPIMQPTRKIKPIAENHAVYKEMFKQYKEFYNMLYKR
jgi:gluconokinase